MDVKSCLCLIVFASTIASSAADCLLEPVQKSCKFTFFCTLPLEEFSYLDCEDDAYVILNIINSTTEFVTADLFEDTDYDSKIREIKVSGSSWTHINYSAFRYFYMINSLDLSNNSIEEIHNEAFTNLGRVQTLNVSNNKIEALNYHSFMISNYLINPVKELDLSNNRLTELSTELFPMAGLKRLHLQNNMLSEITGYCFMNSTKLEYLNLRNNRLSILNITLPDLKMLKTLDISYNNILKLSWFQIEYMVSLVNFNASHNAITNVDSKFFNEATFLETVDFSNNNINTTIENVMFSNNNRLKYLNFYNNRVTGIHENSFKQCSLNYVNFENNNITGHVREHTFTGLRNITNLDVSRQSITGIKNKAFMDMVSLTHLNLSSNIIRKVENSSFLNSSIIVLDLSHNQVAHLNFLQNCLPHLTELYINDNNITVIPKNIFDNQTQMKKLDLSTNKIKIIEQFSLPLINLQYLNIAGNHLSGIIMKNVFSPAKYLKFLDINNFNISKIDDFAFVNLPVLARLNLSNNQIETIKSNNFQSVGNMHSLDISFNRLTQLTFNSSMLMNNLKSLYLSNNKLSNLPDLFVNVSQLNYLDISNNSISNLTALGADILPNLTGLQLANNNVINFNDPRINSLTTLVDLGLSSNEISNINLSYFKELMSVDLSNNNLTYINSTLFKNNENLQSLDVSRNKIADLPPGTFQFMKNLKLLNFSSNYLTKLRFGSLKGLHKMEVLDLSKNNFTMLDVDIIHECDELKTLIIDDNHIKTFDVDRLILMSLKKLKTLSLGGNSIPCKEILHNIRSANRTKQIKITSINKIYHEDNVHGIKCGDDALNESTTIKPEVKELANDTTSPVSSTSIALTVTWCILLTIILCGAGVFAYIKIYRKRLFIVDRNVSMQTRNSIESDGSEPERNLLNWAL